MTAKSSFKVEVTIVGRGKERDRLFYAVGID
jgi:hypothetical protein